MSEKLIDGQRIWKIELSCGRFEVRPDFWANTDSQKYYRRIGNIFTAKYKAENVLRALRKTFKA